MSTSIEEKVSAINSVVNKYFQQHPSEQKIAAKQLMPQFIQAGIFTKDHRKGLPIRDVLRKLDKQKQLNKIPSVHPERKKVNTNWFFVRVDFK